MRVVAARLTLTGRGAAFNLAPRGRVAQRPALTDVGVEQPRKHSGLVAVERLGKLGILTPG